MSIETTALFSELMGRLRSNPDANSFLTPDRVRLIREFGDRCYDKGLQAREYIGNSPTIPSPPGTRER